MNKHPLFFLKSVAVLGMQTIIFRPAWRLILRDRSCKDHSADEFSRWTRETLWYFVRQSFRFKKWRNFNAERSNAVVHLQSADRSVTGGASAARGRLTQSHRGRQSSQCRRHRLE